MNKTKPSLLEYIDDCKSTGLYPELTWYQKEILKNLMNIEENTNHEPTEWLMPPTDNHAYVYLQATPREVLEGMYVYHIIEGKKDNYTCLCGTEVDKYKSSPIYRLQSNEEEHICQSCLAASKLLF